MENKKIEKILELEKEIKELDEATTGECDDKIANQMEKKIGKLQDKKDELIDELNDNEYQQLIDTKNKIKELENELKKQSKLLGELTIKISNVETEFDDKYVNECKKLKLKGEQHKERQELIKKYQLQTQQKINELNLNNDKNNIKIKIENINNQLKTLGAK